MVEFSGWEMPVQYCGIIAEHEAVRRRAGLFDVSHMGEIEIRGVHAEAVTQALTANDVGRLADGHAQYSLLCLPQGGVVDDILVYRLAATRFLLCVNAGNREDDFAWVREHSGGAEVVDCSDEYAQLALQGPLATKVLGRLTGIVLARMPPFCFGEGTVAGCSCLIARTGYTGEDGWEIYSNPECAVKLWDAILAAGESDGIMPAGLGARDTLRLERALPLYGHELTRETSPYEAGLGWVVRLDQGEFVGRDALARQKRSGVSRHLIGVRMTDRGIPRPGYRLLWEGEPVGEITSGTHSPTLGEPIGLGYVRSGCEQPGTRLAVEIRGRAAAARVVQLPFYRRAAASA